MKENYIYDGYMAFLNCLEDATIPDPSGEGNNHGAGVSEVLEKMGRFNGIDSLDKEGDD